MMYYLLDAYKMAFCFNLKKPRKNIVRCVAKPVFYRHLRKLFNMFKSLPDWYDEVNLKIALHQHKSGIWAVLVLGRNFFASNATKVEITFDWMNFGDVNMFQYLRQNDDLYMEFKNLMFEINGLDAMDHQQMFFNYHPLLLQHPVDVPTEHENKMSIAMGHLMDKRGRQSCYGKSVFDSSSDEPSSHFD